MLRGILIVAATLTEFTRKLLVLLPLLTFLRCKRDLKYLKNLFTMLFFQSKLAGFSVFIFKGRISIGCALKMFVALAGFSSDSHAVVL